MHTPSLPKLKLSLSDHGAGEHHKSGLEEIATCVACDSVDICPVFDSQEALDVHWETDATVTARTKATVLFSHQQSESSGRACLSFFSLPFSCVAQSLPSGAGGGVLLSLLHCELVLVSLRFFLSVDFLVWEDCSRPKCLTPHSRKCTGYFSPNQPTWKMKMKIRRMKWKMGETNEECKERVEERTNNHTGAWHVDGMTRTNAWALSQCRVT